MCPSFFYLPMGKTGEGDQGAGGPEARRRAGAGGKGKGPVGNRFPLLIWAEAVCRGGTMAVAGGRRVRRRHCEARQRLGLGGKCRGRRGHSIAHLTLDWNGARRRRDDGLRRRAEELGAAVLRSLGGG